MRRKEKVFKVSQFNVKADGDGDNTHVSEASIKLAIRGQPDEIYVVAEGNGPVNALDNALRKALDPYYPGLKKVEVADFHVGIVSSHRGTASAVKVWIEFRLDKRRWEDKGVSTNIIHASLQALVKGLNRAIPKLPAEPAA